MKSFDSIGAYTANRAAALSGVPWSTIHYWARHDILVPSVSPTRVKLWSYTDLMGLRTILWTEEGGPSVTVDPSGQIFLIREKDEVENLYGQRPLHRDLLNLIDPFSTRTMRGPDLQKPREHLRIVPGKLSGSPHVAHTRLETVTIASLRKRGFDPEGVERLYPDVKPIALVEAVDLEQQLNKNLLAAA
jgi:uncharacterized protein (DUF433 family)